MMVFKHTPKKCPEEVQPSPGDTKVVNYFAVFPVRIGNETRWFERVSIEQKYGNSVDKIVTSYFWEDIKFL